MGSCEAPTTEVQDTGRTMLGGEFVRLSTQRGPTCWMCIHGGAGICLPLVTRGGTRRADSANDRTEQNSGPGRPRVQCGLFTPPPRTLQGRAGELVPAQQRRTVSDLQAPQRTGPGSSREASVSCFSGRVCSLLLLEGFTEAAGQAVGPVLRAEQGPGLEARQFWARGRIG